MYVLADVEPSGPALAGVALPLVSLALVLFAALVLFVGLSRAVTVKSPVKATAGMVANGQPFRWLQRHGDGGPRIGR